jgi:hypothetical protein
MKKAKKNKAQKRIFQIVVDGLSKKQRDAIAAAIAETGVFDQDEFVVTDSNVQIIRIG